MSERREPARPQLAFRVVTEVIGVDASGRLLTARKVVGVDTPLPDVRRAVPRKQRVAARYTL